MPAIKRLPANRPSGGANQIAELVELARHNPAVRTSTVVDISQTGLPLMRKCARQFRGATGVIATA
jgi:hypothetical protein